MATDFLLTHAREFTTIETDGLTVWNELQDAGFKDVARRLLDAVLMAEHYTSELPHNPAERSPEQLKTLSNLLAVRDTIMAEANQTLAPGATNGGSGAGG